MSEHVNCGGELITYKPSEQELKTINQKRQRDKMKPAYTDFFLCKKCGQLIRIITCPSYNDFVEMGKIKPEN